MDTNALDFFQPSSILTVSVMVFNGIIFFLLFFQPANLEPPEVSVVPRQESKGKYTFIVTNHRLAPYQLSISFSEFVNMRADAEIPVEVVLPARMKDYHLFNIEAVSSPYSFTYSYKIQLGDPRKARHDDSERYFLPFQDGTSRLLMQGYNGAFSHKDTYALDFQMPEGTKVTAARAGIVVAMKNDGTRGGLDKSLEPEANHITIYHSDGSFAEYVHLKYLGVSVQIGNAVKAGDPIGLSGNTGFSSQPHLHFAVYLPGYFSAHTIPIRFVGQTAESLQEGISYTASHRRN